MTSSQQHTKPPSVSRRSSHEEISLSPSVAPARIDIGIDCLRPINVNANRVSPVDYNAGDRPMPSGGGRGRNLMWLRLTVRVRIPLR